ncbi:MAG: spermidine synthase [Proteobacteria bacterium]|nr:MAG: spermidine synthase [Pseudomonadota bacterium]
MSDDGEIDVVACEETPLGLVCLRRRAAAGAPGAFATELTIDHQFLMSSVNTDSERALAEHALALHGGDALGVLVGGLGLGYTAQAVLASPRVARLEVVELLAPVIGWLERGMLPLSDALRGDARLRVVQGDVYARLAAPPASPDELRDLVLIDVDHSPDERLGAGHASFYAEAGLVAARRHLAPGGVLGVWSYAESSAFADALRRVFAEVHVVPVPFENTVVGGDEVNWLFFAKAR